MEIRLIGGIVLRVTSVNIDLALVMGENYVYFFNRVKS